MTTLRETFEREEDARLAPHAQRSAQSRGRCEPEQEHDYRTAYQRDRDRILHTKAFRRLKGKTQVFLAPEGDHYRTRLTHTLEVCQIARTIARALRLNEDLTEAIALGHDLGHTPFGHAGEAVLNELREGGFRHFEQSLRVVDVLEKRASGKSLNLTHEVRDGILHHSVAKCLLFGRTPEAPSTLEGRILSISDAIAYINHDVDDALRANLITLGDLPKNAVHTLGRTGSARLNTMVTSVIEGSGGEEIGITLEVRGAMNELRDYLYRELYPSEPIDREVQRAKKMLRDLFEYLLDHPQNALLYAHNEDSLEQRTVDFVAGMTDAYALNFYTTTFFPKTWRV